MARGAKPSDRVYKFCADAGLVEKKAAPTNQTKKHLPSEKTQMKMKDKADKLAKAEEARLAAEAAAKAEAEPAAAPAEPVAETPAVEEPATEPAVETPAETETVAETPAEPVAEEVAAE
jgi:small subunit ribosomal protein S16